MSYASGQADRVRYLSPGQARRLYDRVGRLQDLQFYERPALAAVLEAGAFEEANAVLEFGCGTGRFAASLLERGPADCRYVGLDVSATMVRLARQRLSSFGTRAIVVQTGGSMHLAFDDTSFDRVVSTYVLDLLSPADAHAFLAEAHRVLETGGRLCLASLTHGRRGLSRVLTASWRRLSARQPVLTGGCRPIALLDLLPSTSWLVEQQQIVTAYTMPSEVVVASPRAARLTQSSLSSPRAL